MSSHLAIILYIAFYYILGAMTIQYISWKEDKNYTYLTMIKDALESRDIFLIGVAFITPLLSIFIIMDIINDKLKTKLKRKKK